MQIPTSRHTLKSQHDWTGLEWRTALNDNKLSSLVPDYHNIIINNGRIIKYFKKEGYTKIEFVHPEKSNYILMTNRSFFDKKTELVSNCFNVFKGKDIFKIRVSASKTPFIIEEIINGKNFPYFFVRMGNGTEDFSAQSFVEYWMKHVRN